MKQWILMACMAISVAAQAQTTVKQMGTTKPYTILVLMNATEKWLSLSREARGNFFEKEVMPIFRNLNKTVSVRLYDSEYFHGAVSDFMLIETASLPDYQELIERLRDTKIYGAPYFRISDIIVGQQARFEDFNNQFKLEKR